MTVSNAVVYVTLVITTEKSFIVQVPGVMIMKTIFECSLPYHSSML
jgi:hypothetical protein